MKSQEKRGKIFVGLSGGVDSSVSAALLKREGYAVTGVFIKVWTPPLLECTWKEDRLDAMRVCAKLQIPFITLNLEKEYKKEVVDYMIAEYKAGKTPNPDVMCNKQIKFGAFYRFARNQGADFIATGHYARIVKRKTCNVKRLAKDGILSSLHALRCTLHAGLDSQKDQSYFLWNLKQEQLPHILFPVGGMLKSKVRMLAKSFGLVTADKKDSQGLCFLGKVDMKKFLENYIRPKKGPVINERGETIGTHNGVVFFTLGERHGFIIKNKSSKEAPYYVIDKNVTKNTLTVSHDPRKTIRTDSRRVFTLEMVNWISGEPQMVTSLTARLRYRQPIQKVRLIHNSNFVVRFASPQSGGDFGQSVVIYDGEACLGGGIIR